MIILTMILAGTTTAFAADSKGIPVQYNGKTLSMTDAAKNVNGRVMLPFREILESIGAKVSYDPATKIITAKTADREITFSAGKADVTILQSGTSKTVKMDVVPYIDKALNRTYVPVRFVAESLGYSVGWDAENKTVVIIDPNALFGKADEDFSVISKLIKTDLDMEKPYAATGKFDMDLTSYETAGSMMSGLSFGISGTMSGVQQKNNADMIMNLTFDLDKMLSGLSAEEKAQMQPMLAMFKNTDMKIKMNGETGETYMNSSLFSAMDPTVSTKTWYKMNVFDTYQSMGIDLKSLYGMGYDNLKLSELLAASLSASDSLSVSTYEDAQIMYGFLKNLIGDDAFAKSTAANITTYKLNLDQKAVLAAMAKTALSSGVSQSELDLADVTEALNTMKLNSAIVIKTKGDALYNYSLKGSLGVEDMDCIFDMSGDPLNVNCNVTFDQPEMMKMIMTVESHIKESATAPDLKLPADAVVVDYPMPVTP